MAGPEKMVAVTGDSGAPILVPESALAGMQADQNVHVLTGDEREATEHDIALGQKYDQTFEGVAAPFAAGAARGLSFGLSDYALSHLGGAGVRQSLADYQEYAPITSTVGELAGAAGGALFGNEAGLLGTLGRVGGGAERLAAGALGEGIVGRVAGMGARGAIEGAAYGAGGAISEETLKNHDLTAQALIAGATHGAMGGAIAGGALGLGAGALSRLRPSAKSYESLLGRTFEDASPGAAKQLAEDVPSIVGREAPTVADSVANKYLEHLPVDSNERSRLADVFANREKSFGSRSAVTEKATRETASAFDEAISAGRKTDMKSFGEAKVGQMNKLVDRGLIDEQRAVAQRFVEHANPIVQDMIGDVNSAMTKGELRQWNGWMKEIHAASESGDSLALHTAFDDMKRWTGKQAEYGTGPFGKSRSAREFDQLYHGTSEAPGMMGVLESNVWGDAAARAQKEVNAATSNMISQGKLFTRKFSTQYGDELGRPLYRADPAAISGFYGRLTSAANDLDAEGAYNFVKARTRYLDALESNYSYDATATKEIAKERAALGKVKSTLDTTTKDVSHINQVNQALSEERERGIGGLAGAALDIASKPYTTLHRLAQIEHHTQGILDKLTSGVKTIVGGTAEKAAPAVAVAAPKSGKGFFSSLLESIPTIDTPKRGAGAVGSVGSRSLFEQRRSQINSLNSQPDVLADRVGESVKPIQGAAPKVASSVIATAAAGAAYLSSILPPPRTDPYNLQPQLDQHRASDVEMAKFNRSFEAVDNPLIVLKEAKAGSLSRDHVEAVKAVYPDLYEEMKQQIFQHLVTSKKKLSYGQKIQLGILLDEPTDRTLSQPYIATTQATFTPAESAGQATMPSGATGPGPGMAPEIAGSFQTATQSATEGVQ